MKQKLIDNVMQGVLRILNNLQAAQLQKVLESELAKVEVTKYEETVEDVKRNNVDFIEMFLAAKRVEGCSEKSLKYYNVTIEAMLNTIEKQVQEIDTNDLRTYLTEC